MNIFADISANNRRSRLLTYDTKYVRNVYDLARHRNGDCESFCKMHAFIAWHAGAKNVRLHQINGPFDFCINHDNQIVGCQKGDNFRLISHTVLAVDSPGSSTRFFDAVFGQEVQFSKYGSTLSEYLGSPTS